VRRWARSLILAQVWLFLVSGTAVWAMMVCAFVTVMAEFSAQGLGNSYLFVIISNGLVYTGVPGIFVLYYRRLKAVAPSSITIRLSVGQVAVPCPY